MAGDVSPGNYDVCRSLLGRSRRRRLSGQRRPVLKRLPAGLVGGAAFGGETFFLGSRSRLSRCNHARIGCSIQWRVAPQRHGPYKVPTQAATGEGDKGNGKDEDYTHAWYNLTSSQQGQALRRDPAVTLPHPVHVDRRDG